MLLNHRLMCSGHLKTQDAKLLVKTEWVQAETSLKGRKTLQFIIIALISVPNTSFSIEHPSILNTDKATIFDLVELSSVIDAFDIERKNMRSDIYERIKPSDLLYFSNELRRNVERKRGMRQFYQDSSVRVLTNIMRKFDDDGIKYNRSHCIETIVLSLQDSKNYEDYRMLLLLTEELKEEVLLNEALASEYKNEGDMPEILSRMQHDGRVKKHVVNKHPRETRNTQPSSSEISSDNEMKNPQSSTKTKYIVYGITFLFFGFAIRYYFRNKPKHTHGQ